MLAYRIKQIEMLEFMCNSLGIKLHWTTYSQLDCENFKKIKTFKNYFVFDYKKAQEYIFKSKEENPEIKNMVRKVDGHSGLAWHKYVSGMFKEYVV